MFVRRLIVVLTCSALLVAGLSATVTPTASAVSSSGLWSGTISMASVGSFDYRIGYRGSGTTSSQGTSRHQLGWTLRLDNVQGSSDLASASGSATLMEYGWVGSATSSVSTCGYSANGSMGVTNAGGYAFTGMTTEGVPGVSADGAQPAALSLSRPGGECSSGIIFGFSGPNAGTLGDDQWWDGYLLNPAPPESSQQPRFSLCWHPEVLSSVPAGEDRTDGTRRVAGTSTGSCDGTKVEWFGDSDVSHVMDVDVTYTYDLTFVPVVGGCDDPLAGPATTGDRDGDRLPTIYETSILFTDPDSPDTDCDGYGDVLEVAAGSSPLLKLETPANLPRGLIPAALAAKGEVGITCGRTKFRWVSVTLKPLGVGDGAKGCIVLLGNTAANAVIDFALEHEKETVTTTLAHFFGDHLGELHGEESNDWQAEYQRDRRLTRAKKQAKKAIYKAFNLARYNNIFIAGKVAGLNGVALGSLFALNQLRNKDACIQVRVGLGSGGIPKLSWSLVYSKDQLTKAGVADDLHRASVYKRKNGSLVDKAVKRVTNLSCAFGRVKADGSASEVFESAKSFAF